MRARVLVLFAAAALGAPSLADAKSWQGIAPRESTGNDVVAAFGEPWKRLTQGEKSLLVYGKQRPIRGTSQVQFTLLPTGVVEEIAVFPASRVSTAEVEATFGRICPARPVDDRRCYQKVLTEPEYAVALWYKRQGLRVFLSADRKTAVSFVYTAPVGQAPTPPRPANPPTTTAAPTASVTPEPEPAEPPEAGEASPDPFFRFALRGFVESRLLLLDRDEDARLEGLWPKPAGERGQLRLDLQPSVRTRGDHAGASADLGVYLATDEPKVLFLIDELYLDGRLGPVRLLAGRKRQVWGSGIAANPTDLVNPPKDPLAPEQQRTGAFLLPLVDVTLGPVVVSGSVSPRQASNKWALPDDLDFDAALYTARLRVLVAGFDLDAMYFRDQARKKNLFGLSASGFLGTLLEIHAEARGRSGDSDVPAVPQIPGCGEPLEPAMRGFSLTALAGIRLHFDDQSIGTAEYLFDSNSLDGPNFARFRDSLPCIQAVLPMLPATRAADPLGVPTDPLFFVRTHHVFLSYTRPQLASGLLEDFRMGLVLAIAPEDPSAILQGELFYSFEGRALVGARVAYALGSEHSEAGMNPTRLTAVLSLRASF